VFVPKEGWSQLSNATENPLHFKVDGWNVIGKRQWQDGNGFDKTWDEYKQGFGTLSTAFWTGNKYVNKWTDTTARNHKLRVQFCTLDDRLIKRRIDIAVDQDFNDVNKWTADEDMSRTMIGSTAEVTRGVVTATSNLGKFNYFVDLSSTINRCPGCKYLFFFFHGFQFIV
jgi:hypothetical protein